MINDWVTISLFTNDAKCKFVLILPGDPKNLIKIYLKQHQFLILRYDSELIQNQTRGGLKHFLKGF